MIELSNSEFTTEAKDILARVSKLLDSQDMQKPESVDSLYREVHTLKGISMLFGFEDLSTLLHVIETSFDPIRKGKAKVTANYLLKTTQCFDSIEDYLSNIDSKNDTI